MIMCEADTIKFVLTLVLAIQTVIEPSQALQQVYVSNQERGEQCKELIVQHFLTLGRSQFDPDVVRNCIDFLRNENLEDQDNKSENKDKTYLPIKDAAKSDPERLTVVFGENFEESNLLSNEIQGGLNGTGNQESQEKIEDNLLVVGSRPNPPMEEDIVYMYPENIVQEWPAVEMVRRKRGTEKASNVKAKTKPDDGEVSTGGQPWEKHSLHDDLTLDNRGRNRAMTFSQKIKLYIKILFEWIRTKLGLDRRVVHT